MIKLIKFLVVVFTLVILPSQLAGCASKAILEAQIATLRSQITVMITERDRDLLPRITALEVEIAGLKAEKVASRSRIAVLEARNKDLEARNEYLEARNKDLEAGMASAASEASSLWLDKTRLAGELSNLDEARRQAKITAMLARDAANGCRVWDSAF